MTSIRFDGTSYPLREGQTVLECLLDHSVPIPHSCRAGSCQSCLMRCEQGAPPEEAQRGLKPTLKASGHFLACLCKPGSDLHVAMPGSEVARFTATVTALELLNPEIMEVRLETHQPLEYRAGQFIHLFRDESLSRNYSLASVPSQDPHLHLHVRRVPQGKLSGWVHEQLRPGHTVTLQGPGGDCFYLSDRLEQPLLLIGTGSGLAPLYGMVRAALAAGHRGPIRLFHGSRDLNGLYLVEELRAMMKAHSQFDYLPCLSGPKVPGYADGRAHDVALRELGDLTGWRVYLCGHPEMVRTAQRKTFLAGASLNDIYADAFTSFTSAPA